MTRPVLRFAPPAGMGEALRGLAAHVSKHLFTSADGETYAIGRVLGVLLMFWGLGAPTAACVWMMIRGQITTVAEWVDFIGAMNLYVPALVASVVGLITLTNPTEPKPPQPSKGDDPDPLP